RASGTPRVRPGGIPRFSGRCTVFTPAGSGGSAVAGSHPLPTHTTSTSASSWSSPLRMPRARSSGRVPIVSTTTPTRWRVIGAGEGDGSGADTAGRHDRDEVADHREERGGRQNGHHKEADD